MMRVNLLIVLVAFLQFVAAAQYVGIGTATPQYLLDVNGRMRIKSGGDLTNSAGLWLNNTNNTATSAFVGMQNNDQVGFYGNTSGWSFVMNTITGNAGFGTFTPSASAQVEITSTSRGFLPPRMTTDQIIAIPAPAEGLMVYNTTTKKPNFYNGTTWLNFSGGSIFEIGNHCQGGIIAYILQPGDPGYIAGEFHGLIAAASDQSAGAEWGCDGTVIPGAAGTAIGTGVQNTTDIIAGCATPGIAGRICDDLVLNGYSDWYLPSRAELNVLPSLTGFVAGQYWSSSESNAFNAWAKSYPDGTQGVYTKNTLLRVRAIRAF